jgi:predicted nucleic acid-binding protein
MGATLLDINLLIALFDPRHVNFEHAHAFFSNTQYHPWATTPLTTDGLFESLQARSTRTRNSHLAKRHQHCDSCA